VPDVTLTVGGKIYGGWETIQVGVSIEQIAGTFSLGVSERWPGQQSRRGILPGNACTVAIGGTTVITGYVDDVNPAYGPANHSVDVVGRDATGDLVDCSAVHAGGEWQDRKLDAIVADLCRPFGITVKVATDIGAAFTRFRIEEGESAFEAIERACRMRAVLPVSDSKGGLVLTRAGTSRAGVRLVKGENILGASGEFSWRDRFSRYTVKSQKPGLDDESSGEQTSQIFGEATDGGIGRYRPMVLLAEQAADRKAAAERAAWEANVRAARARRVNVTVQGWQETPDGPLWWPNRIVHLTDDWLDVDLDMLIAGVVLTKDGNGTLAVLSLVPPGAFALLATKKGKEGEGWML
jgi:prophage tail gpP-like protein